MTGLLDYFRQEGLFPGAIGLLTDFARQRQDFANQRLQGLLDAEWNPMKWQWPAPDMQAEMTPELRERALRGIESGIGDAFGAGVIKNIPQTLTANVNYGRQIEKVLPVSVQADVQRAAQESGGILPINTFDQAEFVNANPERIADWNEIYAAAPRFSQWSDAYKKPETGKLEGIQSVCLTK